jgi:hypothetical protein
MKNRRRQTISLLVLFARKESAMRAKVLVAMLFATVISGRADMLNVFAPQPPLLKLPAGYVPMNAWYTLPEPALNAGQKVTGFNLKVDVVSSAVGANAPPGNPSIGGNLVPNPLVLPAPDCSKKGADCIVVPSTLNGVDPNLKQKAIASEFSFDDKTASLKLGANTNVAGDATNRTAPAAGSTQRTDNLNLPWDANGNVTFSPTKISGKNVNALTFGATVLAQQGSWVGPAPIGLNRVTHYLPSKQSYRNCFWTLSDGSTTPCPNTPLTVTMGNGLIDPSGGVVAGLAFAYTNDGENAVELSNLSFATSASELSLDALGLGGTGLFNPTVTLNGSPESIQSEYDVPPGYTLQFLFPETMDPYFIVLGDVASEGVPQVGFAYESQVSAAPEPRSVFLVGLLLLALLGSAARKRYRDQVRNCAA